MSEAQVLGARGTGSAGVTSQQAEEIRRAYTDGKIRLLGIFLPMGVALLVTFAFWDYVMSPEGARTTIPIRGALCFVLLLLWMTRSTSFVRKWHDWIVCALISLAGIGIAVVLTFIPGGFAAASGGIALVIMFGSGAVRMPAVQTVLASMVTIAATAFFMHLSGESPKMIFSIASMLASFGVLGMFYNASSRRDALGILTSQSQLRAEKDQSDALLRQVTSMRAERLTWLENLARFLRHELSNQIVAVSTSIDLARSDGSQFGSQTYLQRAQRSLGRMRGLVSSATEATSLEAALSVEEMERVELSGVVMDRVTAFQELHPSRRFVLNLMPALSVDGNEARVSQLLDKLLGNAVEHSVSGAEIRVGLERVDADWLQLSVENEGNALPEDKARIFEAFVSSQKSKDNLGLGLFVAQSITLNHGGHISAEDLPQGRGARFVVRLPRVRRRGARAKGPESRPVRDEGARVVRDQPPQ